MMIVPSVRKFWNHETFVDCLLSRINSFLKWDWGIHQSILWKAYWAHIFILFTMFIWKGKIISILKIKFVGKWNKCKEYCSLKFLMTLSWQIRMWPSIPWQNTFFSILFHKDVGLMLLRAIKHLKDESCWTSQSAMFHKTDCVSIEINPAMFSSESGNIHFRLSRSIMLWYSV